MSSARTVASLMLAGALFGTACSGSDGDASSEATLVSESSGPGDDASPNSISTSPVPSATSEPQQLAATTTARPSTVSPEGVAPLIEDVMVDLADVRVYSDYQRGLLPPYDDPTPGGDPAPYDATTTACAFNWTRNWAGDEDSKYRWLDVRACEFPDMAAADEYEAAFIERTSDLEAFGDDFAVRERFEVGEWVGRYGETELRDAGEVFRRWNVGRRHGLRYFEMTASDQLVDSEAEALLLDLVTLQDRLLDELGVEPDTPAPGFVDLAARVSLDDVLLPWAEIVELGGEDPVDWSLRFEHDLQHLDGTRIVEAGRRRVEFPSGVIVLRAERFVTMTDAAAALVDVGLAEPIDGIANAFMSAFQSDGFDSVWFVAGDRRYSVDVSESLAANADGAFVERLVAALLEHLDGLGLATEPVLLPHPVPDDPMLDLVPFAVFAELPEEWQVSDIDVSVDPLTGAPMVSMSVEQMLGRQFSARRMDAEFVIGVDRREFIDRFVPHVGSLGDGEWQQRVEEELARFGEDGELETRYRTYFVRHDGAVGLSIWPENSSSFDRVDAERPKDDVYADDMELMLEIGRRIEEAARGAVAGTDVDSVRLVGRALWLVDQRLTRTSDADVELFDSFDLPNGFAVLGAPGAASPAGAVADWWRPTDHLDGDDPAAARSWLRATLFASAADAEAHLSSVLGDAAEPVSGNELGGTVPEEQGGLFATVRGRWYFELVNHSLGRDATDRFGTDEDPSVSPYEVLRAAAAEWTDPIDRSGLA
ncbi:hypothetical protein [Ilumatobacter sp.]|uniref:hypothetical protein n=1 Tax=Ilumatobacter sp. TaxID=1967498 RepID=UPI002617CABE|nr:hypothetical protein [Ilumatobacter sp.]